MHHFDAFFLSFSRYRGLRCHHRQSRDHPHPLTKLVDWEIIIGAGIVAAGSDYWTCCLIILNYLADWEMIIGVGIVLVLELLLLEAIIEFSVP